MTDRTHVHAIRVNHLLLSSDRRERWQSVPIEQSSGQHIYDTAKILIYLFNTFS
jgi:hypothetical protein